MSHHAHSTYCIVYQTIVTDAVPILKLDILTCTTEDLSLYITLFPSRHNAMITFMDWSFTLNVPLRKSTNPLALRLLLLPSIRIGNKPSFTCQIQLQSVKMKRCRDKCRANPITQQRDLDIGDSIVFEGEHSTLDEHLEYRLR